MSDGKGNAGRTEAGDGIRCVTPTAHGVAEAFPPKSLDDYFHDWESSAFGFGYGTGEPHTLGALLAFFGALNDDRRSYDYGKLEVLLSAPVAWLMINLLCREHILEYGTSPRFGWLTQQGERLRDYLATQTADELYETTAGRSYEYLECYRDHCNCTGPKCSNPFWV